MKIAENIRDYVLRNLRSVIIYGTAIFVTLVLALALIIWASLSGNADEFTYVDATVKLADGMRREYLVNESLSPEDYSLELEDGTVIAGSDCELDVDMTTAGVKIVNVSWQDEQTIHSDTFTVTVFGVRHVILGDELPTQYWLDLQGIPRLGTPEAELTEEGAEPVADGGLVVMAELSDMSTEFAIPEVQGLPDNTVVLTPEQYNIEYKATPEGYAFEVGAGNASAAFAIVGGTNYRQAVRIQSLDHILTFTNITGTSEKLTLYVAQAERNFEDNASAEAEASKARGTYVFTKANGQIQTFAFSFYQYNGSHWESKYLNGYMLEDDHIDGNDDGGVAWGGDMRVRVRVTDMTPGEITFRGARADWHLAILDGRM